MQTGGRDPAPKNKAGNKAETEEEAEEADHHRTFAGESADADAAASTARGKGESADADGAARTAGQ